MGYRSYYSLTVHSEREKEIIAQLREENEEANDCLDEEGGMAEETKWYESDEEMKAFSLKHPGVLFEMYREGEDNDDLSKTYYKDGKMQQSGAIITYDEFDESKLK